MQLRDPSQQTSMKAMLVPAKMTIHTQLSLREKMMFTYSQA